MSAQFMFGPNDLALRICAARDCPDDSVIGSALCARHERARLAGRPITLHALPQQQEPKLKCSTCLTWLPDTAFPPHNGRVGGPVKDRRGRHWHCSSCLETRSVQSRTVEQIREFDNARQRAQRAARKQQP